MFPAKTSIASCTVKVEIDVNLVVLPKVVVSQNEKGKISIVFVLPYGILDFKSFTIGEMSGTGLSMRSWVLRYVREELESRCKLEIIDRLMDQIGSAIDELDGRNIPQN
ncbi:MAG: hypothetical protein HYW86_01825 [Candidatus Roizmanbacteria bacterium]|nr:MAG: hypothetical protein HYW86_01825 [Candidatus Roizmanbacteria bacterium]